MWNGDRYLYKIQYGCIFSHLYRLADCCPKSLCLSLKSRIMTNWKYKNWHI
jgi:hypothetical protein